MADMEWSDFWKYMSPHLVAAGLGAFCAVESYLVHKRNQDEWVMPMDRERPFVTFWATMFGIPMYMLVSIGTSISGGVNYGFGYFKTLPGVLGLLPICFGVGLLYHHQIVTLFKRIFGKKPVDKSTQAQCQINPTQADQQQQ